MNTKTNDGGPAFPTADSAENQNFPGIRNNHASPGMSLRDWFAGQALLGDLASQSEATGEWPNNNPDMDVKLAARCYRFADAMLAYRVKEDAP